MTIKYVAEPHWIDEPDWLCAVEFLNDEDPEGRDLAADAIGYLLGYAHLTDTRSLALLGDPDMMAYEILFSFSSPSGKKRFLDLIRSNDELGNEYVENDLIEPVKEEIRDARPLAAILPERALMRCSNRHQQYLQSAFTKRQALKTVCHSLRLTQFKRRICLQDAESGSRFLPDSSIQFLHVSMSALLMLIEYHN